MSPIRLHEKARAQLELAAHRTDAIEMADVVTATPTSWFSGLDPATAWALVWISDQAASPAAAELINMAGRFGYRHARLLLGPDEHPSYSDPQTFDIVAELVLRLAAEIGPSPAFCSLPGEILTCHRYLATRTAHVVVGRKLGTGDLDGFASVLRTGLDLGFAVGLVEAHLAVGLPLAREHAG